MGLKDRWVEIQVHPAGIMDELKKGMQHIAM
jgi:hypothetical protein